MVSLPGVQEAGHASPVCQLLEWVEMTISGRTHYHIISCDQCQHTISHHNTMLHCITSPYHFRTHRHVIPYHIVTSRHVTLHVNSSTHSILSLLTQ